MGVVGIVIEYKGNTYTFWIDIEILRKKNIIYILYLTLNTDIRRNKYEIKYRIFQNSLNFIFSIKLNIF